MPDQGPALLPATELAALGPAELAAALRPLWEDAGPLVARLAGRRFSSWTALVDEAECQIADMDDAERVDLLAAHPRIGAPPAYLAGRSAASLAEQGGAEGVDAAVLAALDELNDRYEARFGFPFVAWVAGRSRTEMVEVIRVRLAGDRPGEMAAGCAALVAIARDRLRRAGEAR